MDLGVRVTHVSYPDAPPVCACKRVWPCACGCVSSMWASELGCYHGDDSSFWIWGGALNVHCLLSSASVFSFAHSPTLLQLSVTCSVNHYLIGLLIDWFFWWSFMHASRTALLHFVKRILNLYVKFVSFCGFFTFLFGSVGMQLWMRYS